MTTVQTMLARCALCVCIALLVQAQHGCAQRRGPELVPPRVHVSPYDTRDGDVLWAVAPLANESGTSAADVLRISDALAAAAAEVRGVTALPVNRTLAAMRALEMDAVRSPQDAASLASALGVDGILVGSITAYDPYDPPTLGLSVALYAPEGTPGLSSGWLDPRELQEAYTDHHILVETRFHDRPASVVSEHLNARNHEVLMALRRFAEGRHETESALGWRRYTASMELYTEFAAHHAVGRLLEEERLRLVRFAAGDRQRNR